MNLLHQHFEAYAFSPEWGPEMVGGTVILSLSELRFEFADGHVVIPVGRLQVEVRPGDEERVTFTDLERPGLEIFTAEMDLLECTALPQLVQAREDLAARLSKKDLARRFRILAYCVAACVLLTILGSVILGAMVRVIARQVPPEWDEKIKVEAFKEFGIDQKSPGDSNLLAQIEVLAAPLLAVAPPQPDGYKFYIADSQGGDANAFALPGGHIVIFPGLLALAEKPEEFLGVLAHEMAHVTQRHQYREIISSAGPIIICESFFARSRGLGRLLGTGAAMMIGSGFSQECEIEADDVGWDYLVKANIDPRGMIDMFKKLGTLEASAAWNGPQAFSTHPATEKRIKRLERRAAKLRTTGNYVQLPPLPKPHIAEPLDRALKRLLPPEEEEEEE